MLNFKYNVPTRVYFGKGQISQLSKELVNYKRILLVYGGGSIFKNGVYNSVIEEIKKNNSEFCELSGVTPNPRLSSVYKGIELCRKNQVDLILAVGGGSVIDAAKAIGCGVNYEGDVWDYFIGKAKLKKVLPIGSILTLSATGSEMNGNTVITNEATTEKLPYGHDLLRPVFSILDPVYTFTASAYQTACGVADIMSHVFEQYFGPETDTYLQNRMSEAILKTCIHYGRIAIEEPENYEARANLMWASSLALNGILSYGKNGDWATHYIEHELSAFYDMAHGAGLAMLTPYWMEHVLDESNVNRFAELGRNVFNVDSALAPLTQAQEAIARTRGFFNELGLPDTFKSAGLPTDKVELMAEEAVKFGQLGMLKKLNASDVLAIYRKACG